jgi:circadian clock protein KaiC
VVVIDSINGYVTAMPEARHLSLQMHELLSFLSERGVASIVTTVQQGVLGGQMQTPIDMSYLADTIILLRYFEAHGRVRKALSVLKKRSGAHEDTIRELTFSKAGIGIGPPLLEMRGVLTGTPVVMQNDTEQ